MGETTGRQPGSSGNAI